MNDGLVKYINYPVYYHPLTWREKFVFNLGIIIKCPVCGHFSRMKNLRTDLQIREYCNCIFCNSQNRQRQIAYILAHRLGISSLAELSKNKSEAFIYNTEASGELHKMLRKSRNYICSEFMGSEYRSGQLINGTLHEDLQNLSFESGSFDVVISADVLEHIPDPYQAHQEILRVLKPGGRHIFTVPFYQEQILDEKRALINDKNQIVHLKEPLYHHDPLSPKGILVYNIFSLEMLVKLAQIGFKTNLYMLNIPSAGIWGRNAVAFEAIKS